jgi:hypothetical protein
LVHAGPGIKQDTFSKVTNLKKRAGRAAQVAQHLSSKCEALSSIPTIAKRNPQNQKPKKTSPELWDTQMSEWGKFGVGCASTAGAKNMNSGARIAVTYWAAT